VQVFHSTRKSEEGIFLVGKNNTLAGNILLHTKLYSESPRNYKVKSKIKQEKPLSLLTISCEISWRPLFYLCLPRWSCGGSAIISRSACASTLLVRFTCPGEWKEALIIGGDSCWVVQVFIPSQIYYFVVFNCFLRSQYFFFSLKAMCILLWLVPAQSLCPCASTILSLMCFPSLFFWLPTLPGLLP